MRAKNSVENSNNRSKYKPNEFWQWNMLENLSSSRGNRSSKLDNGSCIGSSYNTQKAKMIYNSSKKRGKRNRDKNKRENRCCSSIASHNINKSLLASDFDSKLMDEARRTNKINLKSKSKSRKTPVNKQNESKSGDSSFNQKNSLTLSQMFNYYTNHPINEKFGHKPSKNVQNAYRSYTSSSINKKKNSRCKQYPSIVLGGKGTKKRFTSTNPNNLSKKERQLARMLDIPLNKYTKMFVTKNHSKTKPKRDCKQ